jgi:hypothetical protein
MQSALIGSLALVATVAAGMAPQQVGAQIDPDCAGSLGGTALDCRGARVTQPNSIARPAADAGSGVRYVPYHRLTRGPDGQQCVTTGYYAEGSSAPTDVAPDEIPSHDRIPGAGGYSNFYETYPPCPEEEGAAGVADTPAAFAVRFWERVPMPKPDPHIAPGWAIVGKTAYLETNGVTTMTHNSDSPFGPLRIVATGRYYVDWGDGERTGPHSVEGRPWPHGQITHEYQWAGTYDVVVTQRWTATWSLAGQTGILRELRTTGTIDDFPARQIQAVVRS